MKPPHDECAVMTTRWKNVKNRVQWLLDNDCPTGDGAAMGQALCEEIDRLEQLIVER